MLLNCHTYYSLRYGVFSEIELLELALQMKYNTVCLTDINTTSACLNFIKQAQNKGIKPIVGVDFRTQMHQHYVGIAQNNVGYQHLNAFLSEHLHQKTSFPDTAPQLEQVYFIYPFETVLKLNKTTFASNEYIGVDIDELRKLRFTHLFKLKDKFILLHPVSFRNKRDFNIHRLLRAIENNTLLSKLKDQDQAKEQHKIHSKSAIEEAFSEYDFILKNTKALLNTCEIQFQFGKQPVSQNKWHYTDNSKNDEILLEELCKKGVVYRYQTSTPEIEARIDKELSLIKKMQFVPFFLINWDIIEYAKSKGYYHIGRGSGANSIVAYLLGITDVNPIELDLYFERFMNLYRSSPPDFDIDFSWQDREDVTRYIFERFGKNKQVALLATYNTFKHKGIVRELGKVFGLPKTEIDILSNKQYQVEQLDDVSKLICRYAVYMQGIPNHLSIHAGGVLISQHPIHYFTATHLPPKGFPTTLFDMVIAEDVGLYKYDILGQRGLGKIKDAIALIEKNKPNIPRIDIHNVKPFLTDKRVNKMVSEAKCIGCFYVESPGMRMLLKKLSVDSYLGLVAASSIIRPGVAKSGMMREYILRHKNPERRKSVNPILQELLSDTYGVMVYQEDVIKVAHHFAGLTLGESDVLRRAMSGKFRGKEEFLHIKERFFENCKAKGYEHAFIERIWEQIESFAGYAFAKGHSASYAVESYQSLYLKCYFPLEYMVAVLNNGGGFYRPELYIHEVKIHGGIICSPHINKSEFLTTIEHKTIYLGFSFIGQLETQTTKYILKERENQGTFLSLHHFMERVPRVKIEQLELLIRAGAFDFTGENKRNLLWQARLNKDSYKKSNQQVLFSFDQKKYDIPKFQYSKIESIFDEIELFGFPLSPPFQLVEEKTNWGGLAQDFCNYINKTIDVVGYLITVKPVRTSNNKTMYFGTFIDTQGQWIDTVHFPKIAAQFPFRGNGVYKLRGKVVDEFGFLSLEVQKMRKMDYIVDQRYSVG